MFKVFDSWIASALLAAVLVIGLFRTRFLHTPYCPRCKKRTLRHRPCAYAGAPADKATCTNVECRHCFVETAERILTTHDDFAIRPDD